MTAFKISPLCVLLKCFPLLYFYEKHFTADGELLLLKNNYNSTPCPHNELKCTDTGRCISREKVCMRNESLEIGIAMYVAYNGREVNKLEYADEYGIFDENDGCFNGIDQNEVFCDTWQFSKYCPSPSYTYFKCTSGDRCVERYKGLCSHYYQLKTYQDHNYSNIEIERSIGRCPDGEDQSEETCENITCLPHEIKCLGLPVDANRDIAKPCSLILAVCRYLEWMYPDNPEKWATELEKNCEDVKNGTDFCEKSPFICPSGSLKCNKKGNYGHKWEKTECVVESAICDGHADCEAEDFSTLSIRTYATTTHRNTNRLLPYHYFNYWITINSTSIIEYRNVAPDEYPSPLCDEQFDRACSSQNPFRCPEGRCIPFEWLCTGVNTCVNGEDELDQACMYDKCTVDGCTSIPHLSVNMGIIISLLFSVLVYLPIVIPSAYFKKYLRLTKICQDCQEENNIVLNWNDIFLCSKDLLEQDCITINSVKRFHEIHKENEQMYTFYSYLHLRLDIIPSKENALAHLKQCHTVTQSLYILELIKHNNNEIDVLNCWKKNLGTSNMTKDFIDRITFPGCIDKLKAKLICKGKEGWCETDKMFEKLKHLMGLIRFFLYIWEMVKDFQQIYLLWIIYIGRKQTVLVNPNHPLDLPLIVMGTVSIVLSQLVMTIIMLVKSEKLFFGCKHDTGGSLLIVRKVLFLCLLPILPGILKSSNAIHEISIIVKKEKMAKDTNELDAKVNFLALKDEIYKKMQIRQADCYINMVHTSLESVFQILLFFCILGRETKIFALDAGSLFDGQIKLSIFSNTHKMTTFFCASLATSIMLTIFSTLTFVNGQKSHSLTIVSTIIVGLSYSLQYGSSIISMLTLIVASVPVGKTSHCLVILTITLLLRGIFIFFFYKSTKSIHAVCVNVQIPYL